MRFFVMLVVSIILMLFIDKWNDARLVDRIEFIHTCDNGLKQVVIDSVGDWSKGRWEEYFIEEYDGYPMCKYSIISIEYH